MPKIIFEEEAKVSPPQFDFTTSELVNIYDPDFWNIKEVPRKCNSSKELPAYGYSKTTRLLLEFRDPTQSEYAHIKLVAYKSPDGKLIPYNKCNKDIIDWCKRNNIEV